MRMIDLGQAITILANFGVIAGIVFLGVQINQSNHLARAATRNDVAQSVAGLIRDNNTTEIVELSLELRDNPAALTEAERRKLFQNFQVQFRTWENIHYQYRMGLFDQAEFDAERSVWAGNFEDDLQQELPLFVFTWCRTRAVMSPIFRSEVDALLPTEACAEVNERMRQFPLNR